jgi:hypothetical protein
VEGGGGGEHCGRVNIMQILCAHVCEWKMIPVETIPEMQEIKENIDVVNSSTTYLIYFKNFC